MNAAKYMIARFLMVSYLEKIITELVGVRIMLFIYLSIYLFIYLSIYLFIYLLFTLINSLVKG